MWGDAGSNSCYKLTIVNNCSYTHATIIKIVDRKKKKKKKKEKKKKENIVSY